MEISFRPLRADEVEVRVSRVGQNSVELLLYKTARVDMQLLDEVVGPMGWQDDFLSIDGKMFCRIGIKDGDEWVWKGDTGTESNMEAQKGEASDARKRAGFVWGIGRELYTAPKIWISRGKCTQVKKGKNGREQCYDDFRVVELEVEDGKIVKLVIANMSNKGAIVYGTASRQSRETPPQATGDALSAAKHRMWEAIKKYAELHGRTPESVLEGVRKRPEWAETEEFFTAAAIDFESELP